MTRFSTQLNAQLQGVSQKALLIAGVVVLIGIGFVAGIWLPSQSSEATENPRDRVAIDEISNKLSNSVDTARRKAVRQAKEARKRTFSFETASEQKDWEKGEEQLLMGKLESGMSLFETLVGRNLKPAIVDQLISASREVYDFSKCRPGDKWLAQVNASGVIERFRYRADATTIWEAKLREDDTYAAEKIPVEIETRTDIITGEVGSTLWHTIKQLGERPTLIYDFADIFAYAVDFNTQIRPGDTFTIVVEKKFLDGEFLRYGKILAAEYVNQGDRIRAYYFKKSEKVGGYYNGEGKNLERQFLKSPMATVRITSRFGRRHHPVMGETRMHRGVDYGAPTGTPIRAVANGTVTYAGWKGANGRLIALRHANGYVTYYAHLSDIADGVYPGARVSKKQIIGRVGNSGRSTGPHLHFGMKQYGEYVNPLEVETDRAPPLKGEQKEAFLSTVVPEHKMRLQLASLERKFDLSGTFKRLASLLDRK